jgi:hypothetical protein
VVHDVVAHRKLILPQLGAPGVAAHEVKKRTGFGVEYGPVRAADVKAYLQTRTATPEMRQVRFPLLDRLVLVPVEIVHVFPLMALVAIVLYFASGALAAWGAVTAVLAGAALFPILLPWLPGRAFSAKGFILGGVVALPFTLMALLGVTDVALWQRVGWMLAFLLAMPPVTAYLALNFTGSTPFTSKTGVRKEMFTYIRVMAWSFGIGVVLTIVLSLFRWLS